MAKKSRKKQEVASKAITALIEKNSKPNEILRYGEGDTELIIVVSHKASADSKVKALRAAIKFLFREDESGIKDYNPEFDTFALRYGSIVCYTNFEVPSNLSDAWDILFYTPIYDDVTNIIGEDESWEFEWCFHELTWAKKQRMFNFPQRLVEFIDAAKNQIQNIDTTKFLDVLQRSPTENSDGNSTENIIELVKNFIDKETK